MKQKCILYLGFGYMHNISKYINVSIPKSEKNTKSEELLVPSISDKGYSNCTNSTTSLLFI